MSTEAQEILVGLVDSHDDGAAVAEIIDDDTTERVVIPSMDERLAELLAEHDARHEEIQQPRRRCGDDRDLTVTAELEAVR